MLPIVIGTGVVIGGLAYYLLQKKPNNAILVEPAQPIIPKSPVFKPEPTVGLPKNSYGLLGDLPVLENPKMDLPDGFLAERSGDDIMTGAAEGAIGIVNTQKDDLALRKSPAIIATNVIKMMAKGSTLSILNEVSSDGKWVKVISGGVPGWAYKEFIKLV